MECSFGNNARLKNHPISTHMNQTFQRIGKILEEHFLIHTSAVQPGKSFYNDLGMSSLEFTELVVYVEDAYKIQLADAELNRVRNVRDLVLSVDRKLSVSPF